jgi:hypothetical protein
MYYIKHQNKLNSTQKSDLRFFLWNKRKKCLFVWSIHRLDEHFVWKYVCHFYVTKFINVCIAVFHKFCAIFPCMYNLATIVENGFWFAEILNIFSETTRSNLKVYLCAEECPRSCYKFPNFVLIVIPLWAYDYGVLFVKKSFKNFYKSILLRCNTAIIQF